MPPVTPSAMRAIVNSQLPTANLQSLAVRRWRLDVSVLYLYDLAAQDFLLRDGDLLVPFFARDSAVEQLTRAFACEDDEFEPVFLGCSFHVLSHVWRPASTGLPFTTSPDYETSQ